jgi:chemotaxis signal transduction protein
LLWEISNTGFKTQDVFERSIGNLHQTVVSSILQDSRFRAALAIDIMDRNLYERANDCRWWALAPVFRSLLADAAPREADVQRAAETLAHINSLYTVYDNLVLFDRGGQVVAVSNPRYNECVGQALDGGWVGKCLALGDSQSYAVSAFAPTPLYAGRHTYVYAAGVLHPTQQRQAVGGIGIVFDAAPQFAAMLVDALPRGENGEVPPGCFGVFADCQGRVIASTHADWPAGTNLGLEERFFRLGNGEGLSEVVAFKGTYYAVGAAMSSGYREYKGEGDAYVNDVVALIFVPLGEKPAHVRRALQPAHGSRSRIAANGGHSHIAANAGHGDSAARGIEIATFHVDGHWFGIASQLVVEAIDVKSMTRAPGRGEEAVSFLMFRDQPIPVVGLGPALGSAGHALPAQESQIVVLQLTPDRLLGVMVDELGEIQDVGDERIEKIACILGGENALAEGLVKPDEQHEHAGMIMLLSPKLLRQRFLPAVH